MLTRVLREGDQYYVPDRLGLKLVTGNAGGLEFSVDGEQVPEIGPFGTVRRDVRLEPQALKDGTSSTLSDEVVGRQNARLEQLLRPSHCAPRSWNRSEDLLIWRL